MELTGMNPFRVGTLKAGGTQGGSVLQTPATPAAPVQEPQFGGSFKWSEYYRTQKFFKAASKNDVPKAEKLLATGVDINSRDRYEMTGLMHAAKMSHQAMLDLLLKRGADPTLTSYSKRNALHYSVLGHPDTGGRSPATALVDKLATLNEVNLQDAYDNTAVLLASKNGFADAVDVLIRHGADVTLPNKDGLTTLMYAAWNGHPEMVEKLALSVPKPERGNFLNARNKYKHSALDFARNWGRKDVAAMLIRLGADAPPSVREWAEVADDLPPSGLDD